MGKALFSNNDRKIMTLLGESVKAWLFSITFGDVRWVFNENEREIRN